MYLLLYVTHTWFLYKFISVSNETGIMNTARAKAEKTGEGELSGFCVKNDQCVLER